MELFSGILLMSSPLAVCSLSAMLIVFTDLLIGKKFGYTLGSVVGSIIQYETCINSNHWWFHCMDRPFILLLSSNICEQFELSAQLLYRATTVINFQAFHCSIHLLFYKNRICRLHCFWSSFHFYVPSIRQFHLILNCSIYIHMWRYCTVKFSNFRLFILSCFIADHCGGLCQQTICLHFRQDIIKSVTSCITCNWHYLIYLMLTFETEEY